MTNHRITRSDAPILFYQDEGHGPPVLLVHGVGADGSSWDTIAAALADDFRIHPTGPAGARPIRSHRKWLHVG